MQVSTVLVVDGDRATRDALVTCLQFVGVEAHGAENAAAAKFWLATGNADVLVLSDELVDGATDIVVRNAEPPGAKASILLLTRGELRGPRTNYPVDDTLRRPIPVSRSYSFCESAL